MRMVLISLILLLLSSPAYAVNWCDDADIAGCWTYEENTGTTTADVSSNSNDASFNASGKPAWSSATTTGINSSYSLDFNGTDARLNVTRDSTIEPSAITLVSWTNFDANGTMGIFNKPYTSFADPYYSYELRTNSGTQLLFIVVGASYSGRSENAYAWIPTVGTWYHVAATYDSALGDGKRSKLYVDGIEKTSNNTSVTMSYHATDLYIGDTFYLTNSEFNGKLDDMAIFNVGKSSTDINDMMDNGLYEASAGSAPQGINLFGTVEIY